MYMDTRFLICIIIILLLFTIFIYESDHIFYRIKCILYPSYNNTGLPTNSHIRNKIISLVKSLPSMNYTLIDFGCGDGDLINHIKDHVHTIIGVEIDQKQAEQTSKRFLNNPSITIKSMDILDYHYESIPTILYMYEPLWTLKKEVADPIYHKVMKNISSVTSTCYIIYVSGVYPLLDESFFNKYNFEIVHHSRAKRMLGWYGNHIYLFQQAGRNLNS